MLIQRLSRATAGRRVFYQQFDKDGIAIRRKTEEGPLEVAFYHDMAPSVPYRVKSVHVLRGKRFEPPIPASLFRELLSFVKLIVPPQPSP